MNRFASLLAAVMFFCCSSLAQAQSNGAAVTPQAPPPATTPAAVVASPAAVAVPAPDDSHFQNWETMKAYLDSQGINSNAVNWAALDPFCLGTKMDSGDVAYNKCLYLKAKDSSLFAVQKTQCQTLATAHYPDSLLQKQADTHDDDKHADDKHGDDSTTPLSKKDLQSKRDASVLKCMMDLGWASADDWKLGHTTP